MTDVTREQVPEALRGHIPEGCEGDALVYVILALISQREEHAQSIGTIEAQVAGLGNLVVELRDRAMQDLEEVQRLSGETWARCDGLASLIEVRHKELIESFPHGQDLIPRNAASKINERGYRSAPDPGADLSADADQLEKEDLRVTTLKEETLKNLRAESSEEMDVPSEHEVAIPQDQMEDVVALIADLSQKHSAPMDQLMNCTLRQLSGWRGNVKEDPWKALPSRNWQAILIAELERNGLIPGEQNPQSMG